MQAIITRGLLFTHFFKSKNIFSRRYFLKILALSMVSIQEQVIVARLRYTIEFRIHSFSSVGSDDQDKRFF